MLKYLFGNPNKGKKSSIVKQHYINIGSFATRMEAFRLAEKFVTAWEFQKSRFSLAKDL